MPLAAIISDIHGNLDALEAVLQDIDDQNVDEIYCLGDIVGYGAAASECVVIVRERCTASVMGNHDFMAISTGRFFVPERVAAGIRHAQAVLSSFQMEWLRNLPLVVTTHGFTNVHASLSTPEDFDYLTSDETAAIHFKKQTTPLCFIGHTHLPRITMDEGSGIGWGVPDERSIQFRDSHHCVINVGSVGQPRDEDPRASYGLFDTKRLLFTLRRIPYDIQKAQARIVEAGLPEENALRLEVGL